MTFYSRTRKCLRQFILRYFGEYAPDWCGTCYNCLHHFEEVDVAPEARNILRCVAETGQRFGAGVVAAVLCGAENEKIRKFGLERIGSYGALGGLTQEEVRERIRFLLDEGILVSSEGPYPVLQFGERAEDVAHSDSPLLMRAAKTERPEAAGGRSVREPDEALFGRLRALRAALARQQGVPAYAVFTDKTLREMAADKPRTMQALLAVGGVGTVKAQRYGARFLEEIGTFERE